ncbi:MAG: phage holin family protein [Lachnospiraceae bacterium]|nr:phage holin family protein [Lachnospiraceae bacterium]
MNGKELWEKVITVAVGAWISNQFGLLFPVVCLLMLLMLADYVSGMIAAKNEAIEHPKNRKYGWSSKKGVLGIFKKIGYIFTIFVAICVDYLIYKFAQELGLRYESQTYFGLLVAIWFVINESLSILENTGRMGVELPEFLKKTLSELKRDVDSENE